MLQTCCHIYTQTRKYIRTRKKKKVFLPIVSFYSSSRGLIWKRKCSPQLGGFTSTAEGAQTSGCTALTSPLSLTSLSFPLNFLSHYYHRHSSPPSYSFMLASPFLKSPLILFLSPLFICVSSSSFLKRASKEDVLGSFYGNVPRGALS